MRRAWVREWSHPRGISRRVDHRSTQGACDGNHRELEPTQRGFYCGSIGYLSATGPWIPASSLGRTGLGEQVYFQAGGGIVADSDPELEYGETLDKARGLIETLVEGYGL